MSPTYWKHVDTNAALALVVQLGGGPRTRKAVADVLRKYRKADRPEQARWFREHVTFVTGHLFK